MDLVFALPSLPRGYYHGRFQLRELRLRFQTPRSTYLLTLLWFGDRTTGGKALLRGFEALDDGPVYWVGKQTARDNGTSVQTAYFLNRKTVERDFPSVTMVPALTMPVRTLLTTSVPTVFLRPVLSAICERYHQSAGFLL
jgi:hypothetical protein